MNKIMSREEILRVWRKQNKYKNISQIVDGIKFQSKREASRYKELKFLEEQKLITELELQVPFEIKINGKKVFKYFADFVYFPMEKGFVQDRVVEDSKGCRTKVYKLKKKIVETYYNIKILET